VAEQSDPKKPHLILIDPSASQQELEEIAKELRSEAGPVEKKEPPP
jgi:hypothetical protein